MKQLHHLLSKDNSVVTRDRVIKWVAHDPSRYKELVNMVLLNDPEISPRAAWPLSFASFANPGFAEKHIGPLAKMLAKPNLHDAIKRNIVRLLEKTEIPERHQGFIMDTCFRFITDPEEKPAIKAFSLGILQRLSVIYPEIRNEIVTVINDRWESESPAFRSRGKKILKQKM